MMQKKGLSLVEVIMATVILSITMVGVANLFVSGKRLILHARYRMTGGELGRYFIEPITITSSPSNWWGDQPQNIDGVVYTPYYEVSNVDGFNDPNNSPRRVKVTLHWNEPTGL